MVRGAPALLVLLLALGLAGGSDGRQMKLAELNHCSRSMGANEWWDAVTGADEYGDMVTTFMHKRWGTALQVLVPKPVSSRGNALQWSGCAIASRHVTLTCLSPAAVPQHAAQLPALSLHPGPVVDFWRRDAARGAHVFWAWGGVSALFGSRFSRTYTQIRHTRCSRGYPRTDAHTCAFVFANTTLGRTKGKTLMCLMRVTNASV
jgi:hypothetical protein